MAGSRPQITFGLDQTTFGLRHQQFGPKFGPEYQQLGPTRLVQDSVSQTTQATCNLENRRLDGQLLLGGTNWPL